MPSKLQRDGYLLIDNRCSGEGMQELKTYTCNHCNRVVVMNPQRTRERGYCRGCDHYICDTCATVRGQTGECRTMDRIIDETLTKAEHANRSLLLRA